MFKKCMSYSIEKSTLSDLIDTFLKKIEDFSFQEDESGLSTRNCGWVPCFSGREDFFFRAGDKIFFKYMISTKSVSGSKVKSVLNKRIADMMQEDPSLTLNKKDKKAMQEEIEAELMANETPQYKAIWACFVENSDDPRLDVDAATKDAEDLAGFIRTTLGGSGLKITPYLSPLKLDQVKLILTDDSAGNEFLLGGEHDLYDPQEDVKVSYKNISSEDEMFNDHLNAGYKFTKTSLIYLDKISFSVNHKSEVSSIKLLDAGNDEADSSIGDVDEGYEEAMMEFMADIRGEFMQKIRGIVSDS